jgi:hypothetical protein
MKSSPHKNVEKILLRQKTKVIHSELILTEVPLAVLLFVCEKPLENDEMGFVENRENSK